MMERVGQSALQYSARLPNFVCKQVARRSWARKGSGDWQDVDESSHLVSFCEGREDYELLSSRKLSSDGEVFQPWMNSAGEFGSLLRQIFSPDAAARFTRIGSKQIRGVAVLQFAYAVALKHTKYEIRWRERGVPAGVVDAYQGVLSIDPEKLTVLRLTLRVQPLPVPFPVRHVELVLDYGDAVVAGVTYPLPSSFTMVVRLQTGARLRNEVTFSDYRRFTANSRVVPEGIP